MVKKTQHSTTPYEKKYYIPLESMNHSKVLSFIIHVKKVKMLLNLKGGIFLLKIQKYFGPIVHSLSLSMYILMQYEITL